MFGTIDLKEALLDQRRKEQDSLIGSIKSLLRNESDGYAEIIKRLNSKGEFPNSMPFDEKSQLFELSEIRSLCLKYRLRFLDTLYFKGNIPGLALSSIKAREKQSQFKSFKILAPGELFELQDENADPLLFGERFDGRFELIAQWGNDLSATRAITYYPTRNPLTLILSVILLISLIVLFSPKQILLSDFQSFDTNYSHFIYLFFLGVSICSAVIYTWLAFNHRFSSETWNKASS